VARGLVDVEVDRDEEVEARERALELLGVRGAAQRIGHQRDHRAHLARSRREHLLAHRRRRDQPSTSG
jgi:hypothetical protein